MDAKRTVRKSGKLAFLGKQWRRVALFAMVAGAICFAAMAIQYWPRFHHWAMIDDDLIRKASVQPEIRLIDSDDLPKNKRAEVRAGNCEVSLNSKWHSSDLKSNGNIIETPDGGVFFSASNAAREGAACANCGQMLELLGSKRGREKVYEESKKRWRSEYGIAMAGDHDFYRTYYVHSVTPKRSLLDLLTMSANEWMAYEAAFSRKALIEPVDRGVVIVALDHGIAILRLGAPQLGSVVDVLVYSCRGSLKYTMLVEAEHLDDSVDLAIYMFQNIVDFECRSKVSY